MSFSFFSFFFFFLSLGFTISNVTFSLKVTLFSSFPFVLSFSLSLFCFFVFFFFFISFDKTKKSLLFSVLVLHVGFTCVFEIKRSSSHLSRARHRPEVVSFFSLHSLLFPLFSPSPSLSAPRKIKPESPLVFLSQTGNNLEGIKVQYSKYRRWQFSKKFSRKRLTPTKNGGRSQCRTGENWSLWHS